MSTPDRPKRAVLVAMALAVVTVVAPLSTLQAFPLPTEPADVTVQKGGGGGTGGPPGASLRPPSQP